MLRLLAPPATPLGSLGAGVAGALSELRAALRLRATPVVVITGPSGCGKSSLVRLALRHLEAEKEDEELGGGAFAEWDPGWDPLPSPTKLCPGKRLIVHVDAAEAAVMCCKGAGSALVEATQAHLRAVAPAPALLIISMATPLPPNGPGTRALQAVLRAVGRASEAGVVVRVAPPTAADVRAALETTLTGLGLDPDPDRVCRAAERTAGAGAGFPAAAQAYVDDGDVDIDDAGGCGYGPPQNGGDHRKRLLLRLRAAAVAAVMRASADAAGHSGALLGRAADLLLLSSSCSCSSCSPAVATAAAQAPPRQ
jgi:hypothetical protein